MFSASWLTPSTPRPPLAQTPGLPRTAGVAAPLAGAMAPALLEGLPALRAGGPDRRPLRRGSAPHLFSEGARNLATEAMSGDIYAASSTASIASRRLCIRTLLAEWGLSPYPLSAEKLQKLGTSLHAGGYRSATSVLSQYKVDAERRGEGLGPEHLRLITDMSRACKRSQGPPGRAAPLPLERLGELPGGSTPWVRVGPVGPRNAVVVGSWWLLREIEISNLRAALATLGPGTVPTLTLSLPATKSDAAAAGVARSHACLCGDTPQHDCPVHAACSGRASRTWTCPSSRTPRAGRRARRA